MYMHVDVQLSGGWREQGWDRECSHPLMYTYEKILKIDFKKLKKKISIL